MSDAAADWLTLEYGAFVLQLIARRLSVPTLTPVQYRTERRRMLTGRKRQVVPGRTLPLPTAEQLETLAGTWDDALAQAGLASRQGVGGHHARVRPVPIVDVLDRCYENHGTEPTLRELELFARANGIPFPRKKRGRPTATTSAFRRRVPRSGPGFCYGDHRVDHSLEATGRLDGTL